MSKSIRVRTTPNDGDKYVKVELKQDFDFLEILSLKLKQEDAYQNFCSNYGVVAGRISVNNGFGLPNAKVSIFIPITPEDSEDEIIRTIYPYESPEPQDKNEQGIRYNLLPNQQQSFDHTPVGTFSTKLEILDDNTTIVIHEKYYKYTTTTNDAGDFILFGIPVGEQLLHYDVDVSDVGFLSLRPYDLVEKGFSEKFFRSPFKFDSSINLNNLPQIHSQNFNILVEPFWCDDLSTGRVVGITRKDIEITTIDLTPSATFFGSIFSDNEKDSVNKNCNPRRKVGKLKEQITTSGKLESIRRTVDGAIEKYDLPDDTIDDNGNWAIQLPMNIRKVVTDEFGDLIPSPDGVSGIATEGDYRFRISMNKTSEDNKKRQRGKYLVPNMTGNYSYGEYLPNELASEEEDLQTFPINKQLSTVTVGTPYSADATNQYNYLEDFFTFRWKKVYTIRQFIGRYQKNQTEEKRAFLGIKHVTDAPGVNNFPYNRLDTQANILYSFMCLLLNLVVTIFATINGIIVQFNGIITALCSIKIPVKVVIDSPTCSACSKKLKCRKDSFSSISMRGCCASPDGNCKDAWTSGDSAVVNTAYPGYGWMISKDAANASGWNCETDPNTIIPIPAVYSLDDAGCVAVATDDNESDPGDYELDTNISGDNYETSSCDATCGNGGVKIKIGTFCICLKVTILFKCIVAPLFCKKCNSLCVDNAAGPHSCCRCDDASEDQAHGCPCSGDQATVTLTTPCCCQCCVKIPMILLKCPEDPNFVSIAPTLLPTLFGGLKCNATFLLGFCVNCGEVQQPMIGPWMSCKLEGLAKSLEMLKFDFYNDWVNGSLYFPLFKRKLKIKTSKRRSGEIKKDQFCDFDCFPDFAEPSRYYTKNVIKNNSSDSQTITVPTSSNPAGCKFTFAPNEEVSTIWVPYYPPIIPDQSSYYVSLVGSDVNDINSPCEITFFNTNTSVTLLTEIDDNLNLERITNPDPSATLSVVGEHSSPWYVDTVDPATGLDTKINMGGHGHHKNKCNNVYRVERLEFWKESLDCSGGVLWDGGEEESDYDDAINVETGEVEVNDNDTDPGGNCPNIPCDNDPFNNCSEFGPACTGNGVKSCGFLCRCPNKRYNDHVLKHGIIKYVDTTMYYPSIIPNDDVRYNRNPSEYKSNLLLPTNICELGSSVFCDIDEAPFIMDKLVPSTYSISEESVKFTSSNQGSNLTLTEKDNSGLNVNAYAELGCLAANCVNITGVVNSSQIGVDTIDEDDIGRSLGACKLRFDHDEEIREYFCKRFSTFDVIGNINASIVTVNYQRPGSTEFENTYTTYPDSIDAGTTTFTVNDGGPTFTQIDSINDGDPWTPGDRCGTTLHPYSPPFERYFYGLAPGRTTNFSAKFPESTSNVPFLDVDTTKGINLATTQTPYYFYFGIVPGKTALHKVVSKYFADKIDGSTLLILDTNKSSQILHNKSNFRSNIKNPHSILKSCLGERSIIPNGII